MISEDRFLQIAHWSRNLEDASFDHARKGIVERSYAKGSYVCHKGDYFEPWTGTVSGLLKISATSLSGKSVTLAGLRSGVWFGEGTVLKNEPRQYDLMVLRDSQLALMNRATFFWLFENSVAFNRLLVHQLNERLGQFIAFVEYDRMLDATARLARNIAWLFNPAFYPESELTLEITQEELGLLSGLSRQAANKALRQLEERGLLSVEHNMISVRDLARLRNFGE